MKLDMTKLQSKLGSVMVNLEKLSLGRFAKKTNALLVCETDGFTLRSILVKQEHGKLVITHQLSSRLMKPESALADLLSQLDRQGEPLPKQMLLLSSNIIPALLALPVKEEANITKPRMLELVRWEMEALLTEQLSQWNLGWLLIGRGYLSEADRDAILADMTAFKVNAQNHGGRTPPRFGEEALKRELITREQLDECLALQESLHLLDTRLDCDWLESPTSKGEHSGQWWCSAVNTALRQNWVEGCATHNMRLRQLYPIASSCAAGLPKSECGQIVIEAQQGSVCCSRVIQGEVVAFAMGKCCDVTLGVESLLQLYRSVIGSGEEPVYFAGRHRRRVVLSAEFAERTQQTVVPLSEVLLGECELSELLHKQAEFDLDANAPLICAALHYYQQASGASLVPLPGAPPPPPLYKQPWAQLTGATLFLLLSMGSSEAWFAWQSSQINQQIAENERKTALILEANEQLLDANTEYKALQKELEEWKGSYALFNDRKRAIEKVLIKRQQFVEELLSALSRAIPSDVMVAELNEPEWYRFELKGWGLNQQAIDSFNEALTRELEMWGLYVADSPSEYASRNNTEGYRFSFTLEAKEPRLVGVSR